MYGQPSLEELVEAVSTYIEHTAMPALSGRAAFHGRVAVNVLATISRELKLGALAAAREQKGLEALTGQTGDIEMLRAALCDKIRAGAASAATPNLVETLLAAAADRVAIEQPSYASLRLAGEHIGVLSPETR